MSPCIMVIHGRSAIGGQAPPIRIAGRDFPRDFDCMRPPNTFPKSRQPTILNAEEEPPRRRTDESPHRFAHLASTAKGCLAPMFESNVNVVGAELLKPADNA